MSRDFLRGTSKGDGNFCEIIFINQCHSKNAVIITYAVQKQSRGEKITSQSYACVLVAHERELYV